MDEPETTTGDVPETPPETKTSRDGTRRGQSDGSKRTQRRGKRDAVKPVSEQAELAGGYVEPVEAGVPRQLLLMRYVLENEKERPGEPAWVRRLRTVADGDLKGFMATLVRLEEKLLEARAAETAVPVAGLAEDDPGTEKCEEMYERLLTEWGEELR